MSQRAITVDDLNRIQHIEDPQISPDGRWVAYVQVTPDAFEAGYTRNIYLQPAGGGDVVQLTRGGKDAQPRWSPDSQTLAFVSARSDQPQIYLLPIHTSGGEARQLTAHANGASSPAWSPDGASMAYLAANNATERAQEDQKKSGNPDQDEDKPKDKLDAKHRQERRDHDDKAYFDPMPVRRIPYRQGTSYMDDRTEQIYVIATAEAKDDDEASQPRRLTSVDADHGEPKWSPDGKTLYTVRAVDPAGDEHYRFMNAYQIDLVTGEMTRLTDEGHSIFWAEPSPDGSWLATLRLQNNRFDNLEILTLWPIGGGEPVELNREVDRLIVDFKWSADNQIVGVLESEGDAKVVQIDPATRAFTYRVTDRLQATGISVGPDGSVAFPASTPSNPGELYWQAAGANDYHAITTINQAFLNEVIVQETHEVRYQSPNGEVQGWYILPVGYEEGQKYPLALNIHGGPHAMWGPSERTMWHEWQYHAAQGYVVFYCNPRGSEGYGEAYTKALHSAWGTVAMDDVMAGVDLMLEKGFVDAQRMAITGGSYGGYMTAWVTSHTDRFAAAVSQRGVYNLPNFYGTTDIPSLISTEFATEPWEDHAKLWEHSPLAYAHKIKTPLLIIHAENDFRVPIEQAEQLFAYVRRSGGTVEMWRYPREGHELSRSGEPKHRISRLTKMVDWFNRYCQPE